MSHYFDEHPDVGSDRATVTLTVGDRPLLLATDRGVFSRGEIDAGTAVLLRKAPPPPPLGTILDLGCGYGPIALALASQSPGAAVWAVDVNQRALELVTENAAANGLANVTVSEADAVPDDVTFDAIYSNPPIRIGKEALHELLTQWLPRLTPEGSRLPGGAAAPGGGLVARLVGATGLPDQSPRVEQGISRAEGQPVKVNR